METMDDIIERARDYDRGSQSMTRESSELAEAANIAKTAKVG